ncbi:bacillithiol biosynthesis deacetylase BshB2 [Virgibacillus halodenitrificans]|uniref:Bacillithiol biosynthesis deacetylase BshB2 n=1 Tax=Virgibacillus halodenitrificans TaxID=1482 RepID=A0AAC9NLK1_VIRHA|nr:bacillithiol biosynthesis deacetylase BshB2 [Virgibacillus halodenitrificans]APC49120.1 bacillithiol biosynthesis deacetylase BshB2 [Virgibacillus halodenitrificans]MBD1223229.1 bacillithiol biosynthesis deacetylase BshB2 [Virgibacillus halodenitrificans]MCG1026866.1 bacillithiol biosynthesis deacetylase BshB2 [Virgibacillus halodenitrificans]MCJ0932987.1 bacillithiol biosynthesis deacetylase BshB2 [Virgibacillus halodenitrificans]MEC2160511.1 bacillithiol biosynthesis deacetylase BshB2 [Vi
MEKHVVVIYPHPDDESFGAAGTIAKFREQGVPVTYLCGTLGEMGRNMGSPTFANRETLPEIRKQELLNACKALDIQVQMLGYRDKTIEYENRSQIADDLKARLEEIKPSLVITHYPPHAVHPDHNAMGAAAIEAVSLMEPEVRPTVWAQAITNTYVEDLGKPHVINDIRPYLDKKMEAILCHTSQASGILGQLTDYENLDKDLKEKAEKRLGYEQFYIWDFEK